MRALYVCLLQLVVASLLSAAEIEVETGRGSPIHVLVPGEENRLGLRIVNDGKKERAVHPEICGRELRRQQTS